MEYRYLVDAAESMIRYRSQKLQCTEAEITQNLTTACVALKLLASDDDFFAALETMAAVRDANQNAFRGLISDVAHFTKAFLVLEEQAMRKAGIARESIDLLLDESKNLRAQLHQQEIDLAEIRESIQTLRNVTCTQAAVLAHAISNADEQRSTRWVIAQVGMGLLGVVLVIVNVTVAPSVDLSLVGSTVSTHIGVSLLNSSAANLNRGHREIVGGRHR